MEPNEIKAMAMVLFFLDTLFFGCLPYFLVGGPARRTSLKHERIRAKVISYLNCFAGGVFLGACLLHLMVEGRETLAEYFHDMGVVMAYPVYETVVACGFFFIALIEQLAHRCLKEAAKIGPEAMDNNNELTTDLEVISDISSETSDTSGTDTVAKRTIPTVSSGVNGQPPTGDMNGVNGFAGRGPHIKRAFVNPAFTKPSKVTPRKVNVTSKRPGVMVLPMGIDGDNHANTTIEENDGVFKVMQVRPMRAYLLLGAFSFHTTFDGLAVGLQTDDAKIWQMFAAILIHKSLVALSLGLQLFLVYRSQPIKAIICILIFSLISPVGLGIGMSVVSSDIDKLAKTLSRGILEGVSTGTFLYVSFFEILHGELGEKKGLLRLLLVVLGFASTAAPKVFHGAHGHDNE